MGMELGPFREEACNVLPMVTTGGLLGEEVALVAVCIFFMKNENE